MNKSEQYMAEWKKHVLQAADALKNNDFEKYESEMGMMENVYEDYRRDVQLSYNHEVSFGAAHGMFESALPKLFVKNQKVIKEVIKTIKEDKNLYAQFMFLEALKKYKKDYDLKKYINESFNLAKEHINQNTLTESNKKLYSVLKENNIIAEDYINENTLAFYRDCDMVFKTKKSLTNIDTLNEAFNRISEYVAKEAENRPEPKPQTINTIKEFANKMNSGLTESERKIMSTLLNTSNENARKKMFEEEKKKCLTKIKSLMHESSKEEKEKLQKMFDVVSQKEYNKNTIFEEMIKMLEISEIFND